MQSMQSTQSTSVNIPAVKIQRAFDKAHQEGRGVLIPYFMCGYPDAEQSIEIVLAAAKGGADIIELGVPFSDPLADGATIQHAGQVALERGMTIAGCMDVAAKVSAHSDVPLLFMGYYNPILAYGIERYCQKVAASGVSGLIIPDLPHEEAGPLQAAAQAHGLALIFLIPPTAPDERIASIIEMAAQGYKGFIYCVALSGVTGSRDSLPPHLKEFVHRVRGYTKSYDLPIAIGFGISTPVHIAAVTSFADGAAVGSALVNLIDRYPVNEQVEAVKTYIESLRGGVTL